MRASIALAFTAGLISPVSPCGFAMLPAYLSYFLGARREAAEPLTSARPAVRLARALLVGGVVMAGFAVIYGGAGMLFAAGLRVMVRVIPWLALAIGVVLAVLGLLTASGRWSGFRLPNPLSRGGTRGLRSVFLFGIAYAIATLSCTLSAFLAVVSTTLTAGGIAGLPVLFAVYVAGAGAVVLAISVSAEMAEGGVERFLKRALPHIHRMSGALLFLAGSYIVLYWSIALTGAAGPVRAPVDALESIQSALSSRLDTRLGTALAFGALAASVLVWFWFVLRRNERPSARSASGTRTGSS